MSLSPFWCACAVVNTYLVTVVGVVRGISHFYSYFFLSPMPLSLTFQKFSNKLMFTLTTLTTLYFSALTGLEWGFLVRVKPPAALTKP